MDKRHEINEADWVRIKDMFPPNKIEGRPATPDKKIFNGLLWRAKTGCPWRDIPRIYGPYTTIYTRYKQWCESGILVEIFEALAVSSDEEVSIDSTSIKVHQHASGAKKEPF